LRHAAVSGHAADLSQRAGATAQAALRQDA